MGSPDSTTVTCPACRGKLAYVAEGSSRPAVVSVCPTCRGRGKIEVLWRSLRPSPEHTHLFRLRYDGPTQLVAEPLCPHDPVSLGQVMAPTGSPCMDCLAVLADLTPRADA